MISKSNGGCWKFRNVSRLTMDGNLEIWRERSGNVSVNLFGWGIGTRLFPLYLILGDIISSSLKIVSFVHRITKTPSTKESVRNGRTALHSSMRSSFSYYKSYSFSTMFFPFSRSFSLNSSSFRTLVGANHTSARFCSR